VAKQGLAIVQPDRALTTSCRLSRPVAVESHSGARGNIFVGPQTFSLGPSAEKIFEFFCLKWYILAYFVFLSDGGASQTSRGPG